MTRIYEARVRGGGDALLRGYLKWPSARRASDRCISSNVMAGLDPAIHVLPACGCGGVFRARPNVFLTPGSFSLIVGFDA